MMVLSYFLGRKYFKVPYNLQKFFTYLGLAIALYLISSVIPFSSPAIKYVVSTALLLIYIIVIFFGERKGMVKLFRS